MNKGKYGAIIFVLILICNLNLSPCFQVFFRNCCSTRASASTGKLDQISPIKQLFIHIHNENLGGVLFVLVNNPEIVNEIYNDSIILENDVIVSGITPLIYAIICKNLDIITLLIEHKADVNLADKDRNKPLTLACSTGSQQIIDVLRASGAKEGVFEQKYIVNL